MKTSKAGMLKLIDIFLLIACVLFFVGLRTVFAPCPAAEDGSRMTCYWAGRAVSALAAVLTIQAVIRLVVRDVRTKNGVSTAMIPTALVAAFTPGVLIKLCEEETMPCRTATQGAVIVFSVLTIVLNAAALLTALKEK